VTSPLRPGFEPPDDIVVTIRADGLYTLTDAMIYRGSKGDRITVPRYFVTDMASVPRFLSALVPIAGVHNRAAILHDLNCVRLAQAYRAGESAAINAVDTDGLFRQCLRLLGVRPFRRTLYWVGVRWGALFNGARRPGWRSTALPVLGWSVLLLVLVGPAAIVTGATLAVGKAVAWCSDTVVRASARGHRREVTPVAVEHTRKALEARRRP
jgi:hypothetical protein